MVLQASQHCVTLFWNKVGIDIDELNIETSEGGRSIESWHIYIDIDETLQSELDIETLEGGQNIGRCDCDPQQPGPAPQSVCNNAYDTY